MIQSRLFRKYFVFVALTVLTCVLLGGLANALVMRFSDPPPMPNFHPMIAYFVQHLKSGTAEQAIEDLNARFATGLPFRLLLLDAEGRVLAPAGADSGLHWSEVPKPMAPYEQVSLSALGKKVISPGPPPPGARSSIVRLEGEPARYLFVRSDPNRHAPPPPGGMRLAIGMMVASTLLGIGIALFLIFRSIHERVVLADSVISELQSGNLKARFPIRKMDEFGQAMHRFNRMAEEIERLVEHLRSVEKARVSILQDLAHDLRTPVASLKNLLETLDHQGAALVPAVREELMGLALREVDYFDRLVENLLLLAQMSEPRYQAGTSPVELGELLEDEAEGIATYTRTHGRAVALEIDDSVRLAALGHVPGDAQLLRRLFRNALENAFSFARTRVEVRAQRLPAGGIRLTITDDGPGFPSEVLSTFGERRITRALARGEGGRLSVGLGSVIIKTVAQLHQGSVSIRNVIDDTGRIAGAELTVIFRA